MFSAPEASDEAPGSKTPEATELRLDFVGGALGHRLRFGGGRGQAIAKAAGFSGGRTPEIVDATAGLGRDAFLLASLGARVTLIERSPQMHALLQDALQRAAESGPEFADIVGRMTLLSGDARELLPELRPEVVMVDPMHPERTSSALVKLEMRLVRQLVGTDPDAFELMQAALGAARKRVVLKWPLRADPMPGLRAPSHQITGKSVRFDVFMLG
jgi:16S rRNA (guanine1516-N2)-methyltransferase